MPKKEFVKLKSTKQLKVNYHNCTTKKQLRADIMGILVR